MGGQGRRNRRKGRGEGRGREGGGRGCKAGGRELGGWCLKGMGGRRHWGGVRERLQKRERRERGGRQEGDRSRRRKKNHQRMRGKKESRRRGSGGGSGPHPFPSPSGSVQHMPPHGKAEEQAALALGKPEADSRASLVKASLFSVLLGVRATPQSYPTLPSQSSRTSRAVPGSPMLKYSSSAPTAARKLLTVKHIKIFQSPS